MVKCALICKIALCGIIVSYNIAAAKNSVVRIVQLPQQEKLLLVMHEKCASELPCLEKNRALAQELSMKRVTEQEVLQKLCECYNVDAAKSSVTTLHQAASVIVSSGKTVAVKAVYDYVLEWND